MILELDAGNSRIKWRRLDSSGATLDEGVFDDAEALMASALAGQRPSMIRMCSVRASQVTDQLRRWGAETWGLELQLATVSRSCGGVTNQYQELQRMGADRWLAMIAAFNRRPGACVVVDAGTALTVDVLDGQGLHLGGYILPGRQLMVTSLEQNTLIRLRHSTTRTIEPGTDTDAAVLNGILASQVGLLERVMGNLASEATAAQLVLTGGDGELLAALLPEYQPEIVPALVLDGLAFACPYKDCLYEDRGD